MPISNVPIGELTYHQWHTELDDDSKKTIGTIYKNVGPYLETSLEEFQHGFLFDLDYEREISIWARIALGWRRLCLSHPEIAKADPARNIGLMVCYSSGGDIFNEPHAAELIDCYMNPTLEVKP